jgi:hypothetical protein
MQTVPLLIIVTSAVAIPAYWIGHITARTPSNQTLEAISTEELLRALDHRRRISDQTNTHSLTTSSGFFEDAAFTSTQPTSIKNGIRSTSLIERELQMLLSAAPGTAGLNSQLESLFTELAATNPLLALQYAAQINSARQQRSTINSILRIWASNDANAALSWHQETSDGLPFALREERLQSILAGYGTSDPRGALAYVATIDPNANGGRRMQLSAYHSVFDSLIENGRINLALDTLTTINDPSLHSDLQLGLIQSWARQNPQAVANYLDGLKSDTPNNAHATLVRAWAEMAPSQAAAYVSNLGQEHPDFGRATASVVAQWTQYDIAGTGEWLNTLPASQEVDRSVAIYASRAAREDPEGAMSWAASIQNDRLRTRMMERVAGEWRQVDPTAFQAFIETGDWSEDERQRLINAPAGDDRMRRGAMGGGGWW